RLSIAGALLGTGTFTGETASGWQTMTFASPVTITAGTVYVASYHTNVGVSLDNGYFTSQGVDNAPLHALKSNSGNGVNGVYAFGAGTVFPFNGNVDTNYWVDVVFSTSGLPVVAAPTFSPPAGTYTQPVTISTTTAGASIRYTTDGSNPTSTVGTLYTKPAALASTTTIKA